MKKLTKKNPLYWFAIDTLASEYGWTIGTINKLPQSTIEKLLEEIRARRAYNELRHLQIIHNPHSENTGALGTEIKGKLYSSVLGDGKIDKEGFNRFKNNLTKNKNGDS